MRTVPPERPSATVKESMPQLPDVARKFRGISTAIFNHKRPYLHFYPAFPGNLPNP
jgi:hypothetical protein